MNNIQTLTVYLGSSGHARDVFQNCATEMGTLIGQNNMNLVYGGMDAGLMGRVAKAAIIAGGKVTGIVPRQLADIERMLDGLDETIIVEDLWDRKKRMFKIADAIITLPGGYGTLDEALEVLYWGKLGLHNKPLVLVNIEGYWNDFITYLKALPDFDPRFLIVVDAVSEVIPALEAFTIPEITIKDTDHFPHFEDEITRETNEPILIDIASVENSYYAICALGLKQLGKHKRAIGFLNENTQFDALIKWITCAAKEKFITQNCLKLFTTGTDENKLRNELRAQTFISIDLHDAKWGKAED